MFDHWKIHDKLLKLGWKKNQIPFFKQGMLDAMQGEWKANYINFGPDYTSYYSEDYQDPKIKKSRSTMKERAYVAGYWAGEDFMKKWAKEYLNIEPEEF